MIWGIVRSIWGTGIIWGTTVRIIWGTTVRHRPETVTKSKRVTTAVRGAGLRGHAQAADREGTPPFVAAAIYGCSAAICGGSAAIYRCSAAIWGSGWVPAGLWVRAS
eukprot:345969-Rhodomonas_salina.1